ncbi:hypothetical protein BT93_C0260 [Corymbia citriodora subsp. variegata]|nr:hypothetical protein BT93_C0260 [Corymbia citriodora subsp. variegata]
MRLFRHCFIPFLFLVAGYFFDNNNGRASDQQQQNGRVPEPSEHIMLHLRTTSGQQHEDPSVGVQ